MASVVPSSHSSAFAAFEAAVDTLAAGVKILAAAVSSTGTAGSLLVGDQYWNHPA